MPFACAHRRERAFAKQAPAHHELTATNELAQPPHILPWCQPKLNFDVLKQPQRIALGQIRMARQLKQVGESGRWDVGGGWWPATLQPTAFRAYQALYRAA